ncbi:hypothetical protein M9Y10_037421 [Tritrichomonas musculus]|uniref:Dolichyl-phosphate-mannose--protein mannosyltransferase n=1 Tax=Tritrichomonas musculus TaxID=1915356 RepID=A0ABR2GSG7_9EUKA
MLKIPLQRIETFTTTDSILILILSSFSLAIHLWMIQNPDYVCFDEVHFGNFTNFYTKSEYFFDIHPPFGKLVMFLIANFSQYKGEIDFEKLYGNQYLTPDYVILRVTPTIFSSFCSPLIYTAMRYSSFSYSSSFLSGFLVACDTSLLTEHRFILSDGMLHFFSCLFLAYFSYFTSLSPLHEHFFAHLILCGVILGLPCACKNTAWGLMLYTGFVEIIQILQIFPKINYDFFDEIVTRGSILLGSVVIVHLLSFVIHNLLLLYHGTGTSYLPQMMQKQLIDNHHLSGELWGWRASFPSTYLRVVALAVDMHAGNMGIKAFHPYQSRPQNWPLLTGNFVAFWSRFGTEVDCIGNVFVYYPAFFALLFVLFAFKKEKFHIAIRFVIGWSVSFFPFYLIPRSLYLYHYLIPLIFGCMSTGAAIDLWLKPFWRGTFCAAFCILALFGFYLWSPLSYGTPHLEDNVVFWTKNWRYGDDYHRRLSRMQK